MRPHEHYTDEELVHLLLTTQDEALRADLWVEFCCRFEKPVIAVTIRRRLLRRTRWAEPALVEDLSQNTFGKLCDRGFRILYKFQFRHENALRGFLKVMAANVVEDHLRKQKVKEEQLDEYRHDSSNVFDDVERRQRIEQIERCLQQLKDKPNFPRDYKIFWLHNRDGVTAQAIFELPEMGFSTVKGVESALLRLNRWVIQCVRANGNKSSGDSASKS